MRASGCYAFVATGIAFAMPCGRGRVGDGADELAPRHWLPRKTESGSRRSRPGRQAWDGGPGT